MSDKPSLLDLVAPLWSETRVREALRLSATDVGQRRGAGLLLGLRITDGDFFYPVFQFEKSDGRTRVKPALSGFLIALRQQDPWTVAVALVCEADELDGLTPLDWARHGRDPEALENYARALDIEWSR